MELFSEVKLDFGSAEKLAKDMGKARISTSQFRADVRAASQDMRELARQMQLSRIPPLPKRPGSGGGKGGGEKFDTFSLAATGAAATAFGFKATSLANPAAMQRFTSAVEDATAVIGHRLTPYLESLTRAVRGFGDWLARHPKTAEAIGLGTVGLAGAATVGVGLNVASKAVGGFRWAAGGLGIGGGSGAAAAAEGGATAGRFAGMGRFAGTAGRTLGRFSGPATAALAGAQLASADTGREAGNALSDIGLGPLGLVVPDRYKAGGVYSGIVGPKTQAFVDSTIQSSKRNSLNQQFKNAAGFSANPFDWFKDEKSSDKAKAKGGESFGAAARPTSYSDILGSIMSMRQDISSGAGNDPAKRTADASERSAKALETIVSGSNGGNGRDSWSNSDRANDDANRSFLDRTSDEASRSKRGTA